MKLCYNVSMKAKLTDKQENFAIEYTMNGGNATAAYKKHYNVGEDTLDTTNWRNAHKLLKNSKVEARLFELRQERYSGKIMSIEERKVKLAEMFSRADDLKALEILNKMEGVYIEKQEVVIKEADKCYLPMKDDSN